MTTTPKQWGLTPEERTEAELFAQENEAPAWTRNASRALIRLDDSIRTLRARVGELEGALHEIIEEGHHGKWTGHCASYHNRPCDCRVGIARAALEESES